MKNTILAIDIFPKGGFTGYGPLGENVGDGVTIFARFLSSVVGLMTIIAIIWFIFTLITGAIGIMSAGSDKSALESARKKITTGFIGLVVTIAAIFILSLVGYLLGFNNILDIKSLVSKIQLIPSP